MAKNQRNDPFIGWERYPQNLPRYETGILDGEELCEQLKLHSSTIFQSPGTTIKVQIIDIFYTASSVSPDVDSSPQVSVNNFESTEKLEAFLRCSTEGRRARIVSITQDNTFCPLNITEGAARKLLTSHGVSPAFLSILMGCGDQAGMGDEGSACLSYEGGESIDGSFSLSYNLRYVERNNRKGLGKNPWSVRQTGVYHQYSPQDDAHFWILLHPKNDSKVQIAIQKAARQYSRTNAMLSNAAFMHLLILSSYVDNWRWYMKDLCSDFTKMQDKIMTLDISENGRYNLNFESLQSLRHIEGKVIPLKAHFSSNLDIIETVRKLAKRHSSPSGCSIDSQIMTSLDSKVSQSRGYATSNDVLQRRITETIHLLSDALNLKNQAVAEEINSNLLNMTQDTLDDSATVRIVTLVTLIYLPFTFVATLFGMNLFTFNLETSRLRISKDFWIYVAFSVPLTLFTLFAWFFIWRTSKRRPVASLTRSISKEA